ncbi:immunoglobulin E-set [Ochromonadaceae sp. CCMP2298]|nr:immunoglobulin E-set [Ochromonadaceae sp. CCMP2298]
MEDKHRANGIYRQSQSSSKGEIAEERGAKADSKADHAQQKLSGDRADAKEREILSEIQQDMEADDEFMALKISPTLVLPAVAATKYAKEFVSGFRILSMNMRDALTGKLMWRSCDWDVEDMFLVELREEIPKDILKCRAVSREMVFSSVEEMADFRLKQSVYLKGHCIEEWFFRFGCVIPGSTNSWQQTIDAAPEGDMLGADALSGHVVFETAFYDGEEFLCKNSVRIFYV